MKSDIGMFILGIVTTLILGAIIIKIATENTKHLKSYGSETLKCYSNKTCNEGLICASNICVKLEKDKKNDRKRN